MLHQKTKFRHGVYATFLLVVICFILFFGLSCTWTHRYGVAEQEIYYDTGSLSFYIFNLETTILNGKAIRYNPDSVYSKYDARSLRFRDLPFDSSGYTYLCLEYANHPEDSRITSQTYLIADSIKFHPKRPVEFPEYHGLEQITVRIASRTQSSRIEPILVPKDYKDEFDMEYILSIYKNSDSTLVKRIPVKLKVKYISEYYSPFIQGR